MKRNARKGKRFWTFFKSINSSKTEIRTRWGLICTWPSLDISWVEGSLFKEDFHSSHCCLGLAFKNFTSIRKGELFSDECAFTFIYLLKEDSQMIQYCSQATLNKFRSQRHCKKVVLVLKWLFWQSLQVFAEYDRDSHCLKRPRWEFVWNFLVVSIELVCRYF